MNGHRVYFYEDDTFLIDKVVQFVNEGLERQETVVVVATDQHRDELRTKLLEQDQLGLWAQSVGNYVTLDASATLALFMQNGWPDKDLFLQVMGQIIDSAAADRPVRIYGEMVAVLCAQGNHLAAIQLERLWNTFGSQRAFSLLCGYPASALQGPELDFAVQAVRACHSHIESTSAPKTQMHEGTRDAQTIT